MRIEMEEPQKCLLLLVIFWNLFNGMMANSDSCDAEELAMTQWYSQVFQSAKNNQNTSQQIMELQAQLHQLEMRVTDMRKSMDLTHKMLLDEHFKKEQAQKLSHKNGMDILDKLNRMELKVKQLEQKTNGDIVIQRRMDGSVDFFRSWADYKQGFGNSSGEFFIGLEKLHKLTNSRPYELLIVLEDWEKDRRYAKYDQFIIGSEAEKYTLKSLGKYSGSAGDSMGNELGQKFTTKDQDNDNDGSNCAVTFTGAWWYKACHHSNLNGRYLKGTIKDYAQGVHWYPFRGHYYSLKFVEMTIRPN